MNTHDRAHEPDLAIASDIEDLRSVTAQELPRLADTSAWLARVGSAPAPRRALRWQTLAMAAAMVALLAALAMAIGRVLELRLRVGDRSPAQIRSDVQRQLEAGGVHDASVRVTRDSGTTELLVRAPRSPGAPVVDDVHVSLDGLDPSAKMLRFSPDPHASDAEIKAELERRLHELGFDAHVTVRNGHVESIQRKR